MPSLWFYVVLEAQVSGFRHRVAESVLRLLQSLLVALRWEIVSMGPVYIWDFAPTLFGYTCSVLPAPYCGRILKLVYLL